MAERVIVHVGQMKSGTTAIQNTLAHHRAELERAAIAYPGRRSNQQHACYGLCGSDIYWVRNAEKWEHLGAGLVQDIERFDGDVVVSAEALSCMPADAVERFVRRLGSVDSVIVTVRNLLSTLLSAWQQGVKGGSDNDLTSFFDRMASTRATEDGLWRNYAFGNTARWWSAHAPVSVLVVESFAKEALVDEFLAAGGLPRLDLAQPDLSAEERNISLMWEDVELLRQVNAKVGGSRLQSENDYRTFLLQELLFPAAELGDGSRIRFPREYLEVAQGWASDEIAKIPDSVEVRGDTRLLASEEFVTVSSGSDPDVDAFDRLNHLLHRWFEGTSPTIARTGRAGGRRA